MKLFIKKLWRNIMDYGLWTSFWKSLEFLLKPIYQRKSYILYELNLKTIKIKASDKSEYAFKILEIEDIDYINQIEKMEEWLKGKIKKRLKNDGICMVVLKDNNVAGFNLATRGEGYIPLLKLKVITNENEAWSEQITIHKDHRRKGLGSELRNRFYNELNKINVRSLYGHRQIWNIASRQSAKKYTVKELIKAQYIKIFNHERLRYVKFVPDSDERKKIKNEVQSSKIVHLCYPISSEKKYSFILKITDIK
jgi:hypothetical protein